MRFAGKKQKLRPKKPEKKKGSRWETTGHVCAGCCSKANKNGMRTSEGNEAAAGNMGPLWMSWRR
jgi:hypothetical protein